MCRGLRTLLVYSFWAPVDHGESVSAETFLLRAHSPSQGELGVSRLPSILLFAGVGVSNTRLTGASLSTGVSHLFKMYRKGVKT